MNTSAEKNNEDDLDDESLAKQGKDGDDLNLGIFTDVDLIEEGASKYIFMKRLFGLAATM